MHPCAGFGQRQIFPEKWVGFFYIITRHNGRLIAHHLKAVTKSFCLRSKPALELAVARFHFATTVRHPTEAYPLQAHWACPMPVLTNVQGVLLPIGFAFAAHSVSVGYHRPDHRSVQFLGCFMATQMATLCLRPYFRMCFCYSFTSICPDLYKSGPYRCMGQILDKYEADLRGRPKIPGKSKISKISKKIAQLTPLKV